jgi:hypothetical protein
MMIVMNLLLWAALLCIYMIPWGISKSRNHHNSLAIFWLNFLFGWSVLGWFSALIWACTSPAPVRS